jgi:hypothetical protein
MIKEEFFAVGGTDQHLNDPKFDEKEFMTNFSEEDEFGITSPLIDESDLIYAELKNIEGTPSLYEIDMEYGCQHQYDSGYDDGYYEAKKKYGFYLTSHESIMDYEWEQLLRNLNKIRYNLKPSHEEILNQIINQY